MCYENLKPVWNEKNYVVVCQCGDYACGHKHRTESATWRCADRSGPLKKCPRHEWTKRSYTAYHECSRCGQRKADKLIR